MGLRFIKTKRNSHGAAAMLVTTAMALLFVILVVALSWLSIREQRLAGDTDLSNRAISSAEAGLKDGFALLANDSDYRESSCDEFKTKSPATADNNWQCRIIDDSPGPVRLFARKDQPRKALIYDANYNKAIKPPATPIADYSETGVRYATDFEVYWCKVDGPKCDTPNSFPSYYPDVTTYQTSDLPATLELTFTYWKSSQAVAPGTGAPSGDGGGNVNKPSSADDKGSAPTYNLENCPACADRNIDDSSAINTKTVMLYPVTGIGDVSPAAGHHNIGVKCDAQVALKTGYYCKSDKVSLPATIYGDSEANAYKYRLIFSATPRYADSFIEARFYNDNIATTTSFPSGTKLQGDIVPVPASSIIVDVTAKSGNVYRRLTAYKAKTTEARADIFAGVYSGVDICKNMEVDPAFNVLARNDCDKSGHGYYY